MAKFSCFCILECVVQELAEATCTIPNLTRKVSLQPLIHFHLTPPTPQRLLQQNTHALIQFSQLMSKNNCEATGPRKMTLQITF